MAKDLCNINAIGKNLVIDKLVKMHILKIFKTSDICHFGLASLAEEP